jgi:Family of unknown function (DUF6011)
MTATNGSATATVIDAEFDAFMERGRRWRELLPEGRYAWPLYGWDRDNEDPPLIGHAVYWHRKGGRLSMMLIKVSPDITTNLLEACHWVGNGPADDREYLLATFVEDPKTYAGQWGMHTGHCGFCGRALTDPKSKEIGIGPECLRNNL